MDLSMKPDSPSTKIQSPKRQETPLIDENQAFIEAHQEEEAHSRNVSTQNIHIFLDIAFERLFKFDNVTFFNFDNFL